MEGEERKEQFSVNPKFMSGFSDIKYKGLRLPCVQGRVITDDSINQLSHGGDLQWLLNH